MTGTRPDTPDSLVSASGRTPAAHQAARRYIGYRVGWRGDDHGGTITGTTKTRNGYARWVIEWDAGTPDWWSTVIAPSAGGLIIVPTPENTATPREGS